MSWSEHGLTCLLHLAAAGGCLQGTQSIVYDDSVLSSGAGSATYTGLIGSTGKRARDRRGADMCAAGPCGADLAGDAAACQRTHLSIAHTKPHTSCHINWTSAA